MGTAGAMPTGCFDFEVETPRANKGPVIYAAAFGVNETNEQNAVAANRAFAEARRVKASRVVFARGVYRCFDGPGLQIEGLEDCVVDGDGATFVFRRVGPKQDDPSVLVDGYGNVEIKDCKRTEVRDFNIDWDWEHDPLAVWCTCVDAVENKEDNASFIDFELEKPHPKYPQPVVVQLLTPMTKDKKPCMENASIGMAFFSTSAGSMGAKMQWLSPTRMRVWPYVRSEDGYQAPYDNKRYGAAKNRTFVRLMKKKKMGEKFTLAHHYYGMNGVVLTSNRHFTLRNVEIWATCGMGVETRGAQKWWQLINVNIRSKPGENYPVTATADAHHIVQSQGFGKMIDCEVMMHRDDHINYHDRTQIAWTIGARELEVVNGRGIAYTHFKVGTRLRLRQHDFASIPNWAGRILSIDGERILLDRDLPKQTGLFFVLIDDEYATENFIFRNCRFHASPLSRGIVAGNNFTFEKCTFGPMNGAALSFQSCITYNVWCEGIGCTNVVVRGCRFDTVQAANNRVNGVNAIIFSGFKAPFTGYGLLSNIGGGNVDFMRAIKSEEASGKVVMPSADSVGDILIEGCTFVNPRGYLWYIQNGNGFWFRNNKVIWDNPNAPRPLHAGSIRVDTATNVHVPTDMLNRGK